MTEVSEQYVERRLPQVVDGLRRRHRLMRRRTAVKLLRETLHFLDTCAVADEPLAPSRRVDKAWHEFILHTRLYSEWCEKRYGHLIHHTPAEVPDGEAYRRAYKLLSARYGPLDKAIWPVPRGMPVPLGLRGRSSCDGMAGAGCGGD